MSGTTLLVPIRYPLKAPGVKTIRHAVDLADRLDGAHLFIVHVNLLYKGENVDRTKLRRAVEREVGSLANASYHVRDAFLLEEAILNEVCHQDADYVVIGESMRARWRRLLATRLGVAVDLEEFLRRHLDAELVVI